MAFGISQGQISTLQNSRADEEAKKRKALDDRRKGILSGSQQSQDIAANQASSLEKFAAARKQSLGAREREGLRRASSGLDRFAAITGRTGGAIQKARAQEERDIGRQFADVASNEASQIEALKQQNLEAQAGRAAGREQLAQAGEQFDRQIEEMGRQFDTEMDLNKKTFVVNALSALEATGLDNIDSFNNFLQTFGQLFPGLRPRAGGDAQLAEKAGGAGLAGFSPQGTPGFGTG